MSFLKMKSLKKLLEYQISTILKAYIPANLADLPSINSNIWKTARNTGNYAAHEKQTVAC